ncbi:MAG: nuclear transport factor 2 family protein [Solirubrobacterales bacterium]
MAQDNVELIKGGFDALKENGVEGLLPLIAQDFEVTTPAALASEPDTYRGPEGIRRYFDSFYEVMEDIYFEGHEFIAVGGKVVVDFTLHARGRTTGIEAGQRAFQVWTARGDKATRLEVFVTREEAMAAAAA